MCSPKTSCAWEETMLVGRMHDLAVVKVTSRRYAGNTPESLPSALRWFADIAASSSSMSPALCAIRPAAASACALSWPGPAPRANHTVAQSAVTESHKSPRSGTAICSLMPAIVHAASCSPTSLVARHKVPYPLHGIVPGLRDTGQHIRVGHRLISVEHRSTLQ